MRKMWKSDVTAALSIVFLFVSAVVLLVDSGASVISVYGVGVGLAGVPLAYLTERFAKKGE